MTKKIKSLLISLAAMAVALAPTVALAPAAFAANQVNIGGSLCQGSGLDVQTQPSGSPACDNSSTGNLQTLLTNIINWFSIIVGVIAVIMIIVGGLKYITSGGESGKVSSAKTTIMYALIGLVVVALAQLIVHFVLGQAQTIVTG